MRDVDPRNVSTTGTIDGWTIDSYRGTVVAHAVVGAGLLTEFFAGFSDIFGGRSESIRRRLAEVYRDATEQLRREAATLGANWIVGYRADLDEISGKGTFMFMVTTTGTAVVATPRQPIATTTAATQELASHELLDGLEKKRIESITDTGALDSEELWSFLIQRRLRTAAPLVLRWVRERYGDLLQPERRAAARSKAQAYFASLPGNEATAEIYAAVVRPAVGVLCPELDLITSLHLLDLSRTATLLESQRFDDRWWGLQTLQGMQGSYRVGDAESMDRCIKLLEGELFPPMPLREVPRPLGLGKTSKWSCLSGHPNDANAKSCYCGFTRQGLGPNDFTPDKARERLILHRQILGERFGIA